MKKKKESNSKDKQVEMFNISYEANIYYPKQNTNSSKGISIYKRSRNSGSMRERSSSFQLANY